MAGIPLGAHAPHHPSQPGAECARDLRLVKPSRKLRLHGAFSLAGHSAAAVTSSRRAGERFGVAILLRQGLFTHTARMQPAHARAIAQALDAAATAAEAASPLGAAAMAGEAS